MYTLLLTTALAAAPATSDAGVVASPEVASLVERMQGFYERTRDFRADFEQRYKYQTFHREQKSKGTVLFKKPGLMRWEYPLPTPRVFVLAEGRAYALDVEARTLTKTPLDTSQLSTSITFLWGKGRLTKEFDITREPCPSCTGTKLRLEPRAPDGRFQRIFLEVDPKSAQVLATTVIDPDGSENTIRFSNLKANVGLTQEDFTLHPPQGTSITDLTARADAGTP